jgi:hypothetical protein
MPFERKLPEGAILALMRGAYGLNRGIKFLRNLHKHVRLLHWDWCHGFCEADAGRRTFPRVRFPLLRLAHDVSYNFELYEAPETRASADRGVRAVSLCDQNGGKSPENHSR